MSGTRLILIRLRLATIQPSISALTMPPLRTMISLSCTALMPAPPRSPWSCRSRSRLVLGGVAGEGEEHVVERRPAQADVEHLDLLLLEPAQHPQQRLLPVVDRHVERPPVVADLDLAPTCFAEHPTCGVALSRVGEHDLDPLAADLRLQLVGRAAGDRGAVVDHHDVVGQPVGLLEVLRGQQQGRSARHQVADHVPHLLAGADVEAGGRLVEDQHRGRGHQRTGQVEPAPHAAGVGLRRPVGGIGEVEPLEQLARPIAGPGLAQAVEPADHLEVLVAGQVLVDRGVLPRETDPRADAGGVLQHVDAGDRGTACVGLDQRGQHPHGGGLAGAVGAEQRQHLALRNGEVEALERLDLLVSLDQPGGQDHVTHRISLSSVRQRRDQHRHQNSSVCGNAFESRRVACARQNC